MKIQVGEIYMSEVTQQKTIYTNKTRKYLLPCLKEYGANFIVKLENVFKIAVGIGDIVVSNRGIKHEKHIFILLESTIAPNHFIEFLEWIKQEPMYEDDYVFNNIQKSTSHMIVLKIPEKFYDSFETFKLGDYSKMYTRSDIDLFFKSKPEIKQVLIKDHNYKIKFIGKLNKVWGTTIKPSEWEGELDTKIDHEEIFNHHLKSQ